MLTRIRLFLKQYPLRILVQTKVSNWNVISLYRRYPDFIKFIAHSFDVTKESMQVEIDALLLHAYWQGNVTQLICRSLTCATLNKYLIMYGHVILAFVQSWIRLYKVNDYWTKQLSSEPCSQLKLVPTTASQKVNWNSLSTIHAATRY